MQSDRWIKDLFRIRAKSTRWMGAISLVCTEGKFRGAREIIYVVVIDGFSPNWAGSKSLIVITKFKPCGRSISRISLPSDGSF